MSISSLTNIAQSALMAQETAIQVAGQNIANAQTPGYSRETLALTASTPNNTPNGIIGTGVSIGGITRSRDTLLDQQYRTQSAPASGYQERSTLLGQIQDVYGEPSTTGLASTMDNFFEFRGASSHRIRPTRARRPSSSRRARSSRRPSTATRRSCRTSPPIRGPDLPTPSRR